MNSTFDKVKEEFIAVLPPTILFFVTLHIVSIVRVLMSQGSSFQPASVSIAVAALILGKSVLIADMLPLIDRYPDQPLAFNVTWKSTVYLLIATVIHYLERLFEFSRKAG